MSTELARLEEYAALCRKRVSRSKEKVAGAIVERRAAIANLHEANSALRGWRKSDPQGSISEVLLDV